jgi:hypothetical protein
MKHAWLSFSYSCSKSGYFYSILPNVEKWVSTRQSTNRRDIIQCRNKQGIIQYKNKRGILQCKNKRGTIQSKKQFNNLTTYVLFTSLSGVVGFVAFRAAYLMSILHEFGIELWSFRASWFHTIHFHGVSSTPSRTSFLAHHAFISHVSRTII